MSDLRIIQCDPWIRTRRKKAKLIANDRWEAFRPHITRLHGLGRSQKFISVELKEKHGFEPTPRQLWLRFQQWELITYSRRDPTRNANANTDTMGSTIDFKAFTELTVNHLAYKLSRPVRPFDLPRVPDQQPSSPMLNLLSKHTDGPCSECQIAIDNLQLWTVYLRPLSKHVIGEGCRRNVSARACKELPYHELVARFSTRHEHITSVLRKFLCSADVHSNHFPCMLVLVYCLLMLNAQFKTDERNQHITHKINEMQVPHTEVDVHIKAAATILDMIASGMIQMKDHATLNLFTRFHELATGYAKSSARSSS